MPSHSTDSPKNKGGQFGKPKICITKSGLGAPVLNSYFLSMTVLHERPSLRVWNTDMAFDPHLYMRVHDIHSKLRMSLLPPMYFSIHIFFLYLIFLSL